MTKGRMREEVIKRNRQRGKESKKKRKGESERKGEKEEGG